MADQNDPDWWKDNPSVQRLARRWAERERAESARLREDNPRLIERIAKLEAERDGAINVARVMFERWRKAEQQAQTLQEPVSGEQEHNFQRQQRIERLERHISPNAAGALAESENEYDKFMRGDECDAFVMSVDIRRSTDLMLNARSGKQFAEFLFDLCATLKDNIFDHHGVFDKFTGDGVLAYFWEGFTGADAGYLAVAAAEKCHELVSDVYRRHHSAFKVLRPDFGVGVGIDFGPVTRASVGRDLTVVGDPVVYACRFGAAPAGETLLNQRAYEQIEYDYREHFTFDRVTLSIKECGVYAHRVVSNGNTKQKLAPPAWKGNADVEPSSNDQAQTAADTAEDKR